MSERHLIQSTRKRAFLRAVDALETLHVEPDDLAAQLSEGNTAQTRKYLRKFDSATSRVLSTFFKYMSAMERRVK